MHRITIRYCPQCNWLARAAWYAQELLNSFHAELSEVALVPSGPGVFEITLGDVVVMNRKTTGFLVAKALKQAVRDVVAPTRDMGHVDA